MAKKTKKEVKREIVPAPPIIQPITETIEKNYMPYVMTVIISRAIPEIDGFKPSHRKLLYTMYTMGLLKGPRTKSANIVGQTMHLNPHGDASIYETMVRLTKGNASLLHPFIDSKGSFGKQYSRDMAYAASRYTEAKLDSFCEEIFKGIDKNAVDMVPNYDNTTEEPTLLPTAFPNILVSPNMGIAVGLASNICSFNLGEICDGTIAVLDNPKIDTETLMTKILAPDFPGGAQIIYDKEKMKNLFETGNESITLRSKYRYDKQSNCIEVLEIPYSTSIEAILKKLTDMMKEGSLKEVSDMRDEIDLHGFKLTIDLKKGTDPEVLMSKLFKKTPLQDNFPCNFTVLINGEPKQLGIRKIIDEWILFRLKCVKRELTFDLDKKKAALHLLMGLGAILLDIDKAIAIIRETEKESDVVPNLMQGFDIDELQAEYIAEIKLRHLNREYLLNRISDIENLQSEIAELSSLVSSEAKLKKYIIKQLTEIKKKYSQPRRSEIIYNDNLEEYKEAEHIENYNAKLYLTKEGYFKKITLQSLRASDNQTLKEGDEIRQEIESDNLADLYFISSKGQMYRSKASDFDTCKASSLGDYIPAKLGFDENEYCIYMLVNPVFDDKYKLVCLFENGKGLKIPMSVYETKGYRRKLTNIYSSASPIVGCFLENEKDPFDILLVSSDNKGILFSSKLIPEKTTRTSSGNTLYKLKANEKVTNAIVDLGDKKYKCKKIKLPAQGTAIY